MTTGEIVATVYDRLSEVDGCEMFDIMSRVDFAHKTLHQHLRFKESIVTDDFTWATSDGTTKDITASTTRWSGRPIRIWEGSSAADRWVSFPLLDVLDWQVDGDVSTVGTGRIYAIQGTSLVLVAAPTSDITVNIRHYPYPADLNDDTDTPTIPVDYHNILVLAAERDMWERFYAIETNPTLKRGFLDKFKIADERYEKMYRKLVGFLATQNKDDANYVPSPLWKPAHDNMARRRTYARGR